MTAIRLGRPGVSRKRRPRALRNRSPLIGWLFLAPFAVIFVAFIAVPIVASLLASLTDMRSTDLRTPFYVDLVGVDNYVTLFTDPGFLSSIANTLVFVVVGVPLTMAIGLALALALNAGIRRTRGILRAMFFAPVVANIVSVAIVWQYAFNPSGTVNELLGAVGISGPNWLSDTHLAMPVVILLGIWRNFGTAMLLFLGGLQAVPEDVAEAASLDGAGRGRRLWSITLPLLMPTILLISVLLTVFFLQVFDEPYLLTNGGPLGSTRSIALYTYEQFGFGNFGISSASSWFLLVLVVVIAAIQFRLLRSRT